MDYYILNISLNNGLSNKDFKEFLTSLNYGSASFQLSENNSKSVITLYSHNSPNFFGLIFTTKYVISSSRVGAYTLTPEHILTYLEIYRVFSLPLREVLPNLDKKFKDLP